MADEFDSGKLALKFINLRHGMVLQGNNSSDGLAIGEALENVVHHNIFPLLSRQNIGDI